MRLNPEIKASLRRFRQQKRAFRSLVVLGVVFLLTLPAELWCNHRPLAIRFDGRWYFPVVRRYTELDFGGRRPIEPDYHSSRFLRTIDGRSDHHDPQTHTPTPDERDILDLFDPEPHDVAQAERPADEYHILKLFDPEADDVALPAAPPMPGRDEAPTTQAWILWPPVPYNYAYITMESRSGRDALASPWGQVIPSTGKQYPSSWVDRHYLGTDDRGRDVLARLVYGLRVSLLFGLALAVSSTVVGLILGAVQGYFGGWTDLLGQRMTEIWGSLPQLYLLMILSSMLARNIYVLFIILNLTSWMGMAAYMRAEFLRGRNLDYVRAAHSLGVANPSIMFRHILPNSLTPIITFFPFSVTGGILALVSLDFLGLGVPSPFPSLGELLSQGQANLHATWIIVPTFIVLSGAITLLTFVGDGLRNAFDPRRKVSG